MEGKTRNFTEPQNLANIRWPKPKATMQRVRQPFNFIKNALTGAVLGSLAIGVYAYSIRPMNDDTHAHEEDCEGPRTGEASNAPLKGTRDYKSAIRAAAVEKGKEATQKISTAFTNRFEEAGGAVSDSRYPDRSTLSDFDVARSIVDEVVEEADAWLPSRTRSKGLLVDSFLDRRYPWLLDPTRRTLVWGAPPIDDIGPLRD
ncbi:hypothetical protein VNI00_012797 [Paramarasmius palmivorus]|uniref:Cytochrome c oxidase assembly factor 3 mitochondrial coiled-coil domain-containing protein n=1 Tax=Paramarasmius palmivorus TaxID=297713 RepID=A0AAW0C3X5_9AGAR